MNIIVTGANGFLGRNLLMTLKTQADYDIFLVTRQTTDAELAEYAQKADFVFHLAGVNRPKNEAEFMVGNADLTLHLLNILEQHNSQAPILLSSSIQAAEANPYGISKKAAEDLVLSYGKRRSIATYIYRLPNLFGKWSKPNYNSVIATFCYNIARDLPIKIYQPETELTLAYVDDVLAEFMQALKGEGTRSETSEFYEIPVTYTRQLGQIADLLRSFKATRQTRFIPDMADDFTRKLYSTYLNFLPADAYAYPLVTHSDERGSFTEFVKSNAAGQVSVNVSKPGVTKGDHWHHSKNEKFLVVAGEAVIKLRDVFADEVLEYAVSGERLQVVDIPPGYTHSIVNVGETDLVTVMWVNEPYDADSPDTYGMEVEP